MIHRILLAVGAFAVSAAPVSAAQPMTLAPIVYQYETPAVTTSITANEAGTLTWTMRVEALRQRTRIITGQRDVVAGQVVAIEIPCSRYILPHYWRLTVTLNGVEQKVGTPMPVMCR